MMDYPKYKYPPTNPFSDAYDPGVVSDTSSTDIPGFSSPSSKISSIDIHSRDSPVKSPSSYKGHTSLPNIFHPTNPFYEDKKNDQNKQQRTPPTSKTYESLRYKPRHLRKTAEEPTPYSTDLGVEPGLVLRKICNLIESKKYRQCALLVERVTEGNLLEVAPNLPYNDLLKAYPETLCVFNEIFVKLGLVDYPQRYQTFPIEKLNLDKLVKHLVNYYAHLENRLNDSEVIPQHFETHVANLLKVIIHFNSDVKIKLYKRKRALELCLEGLGKHGVVHSKDQRLIGIHSALKTELNTNMQKQKSLIPKLDEFCSTPSKGLPLSRGSSASSLPLEASHQRLLQFTQTEVENRLIKNKTIFIALEKLITNQELTRLMHMMEERISCDKTALFQFSELKKYAGGTLPPTTCIAPTFQYYISAYGKVLNIMRELTESDDDVFDCPAWQSDSDIDTWSNAGSFARDRLHSSMMSASSTHSGKSSFFQFEVAETTKGRGAESASFLNGYRGDGVKPSTPLSEREMRELEILRNEVYTLRQELSNAREVVSNFEEREKDLKDRISVKAQKSVESGSKFEDLNLGENRPTQLIRRYGNLYSQSRVDALDALDALPDISDYDDLKGKLLFSVVVLSFRVVLEELSDLKAEVRRLLCLPTSDDDNDESHDVASKEMENSIMVYLRKSTHRFELKKSIETVSNQIWSTLYDYPNLKECSSLQQYIEECVHLSWALSIQNPPFIIEYDAMVFDDTQHQRFYQSDPDSILIRSFLWPSLLEKEGGPCVFKGVVVT